MEVLTKLDSLTKVAPIPTIKRHFTVKMFWDGGDMDLALSGVKANGDPWACYTEAIRGGGGYHGKLEDDGYEHKGDAGIGGTGGAQAVEVFQGTADFLKGMRNVHVILFDFTATAAKTPAQFKKQNVKFVLEVDGNEVISSEIEDFSNGSAVHMVDIAGGDSPTVTRIDAVLKFPEFHSLPGLQKLAGIAPGWDGQ